MLVPTMLLALLTFVVGGLVCGLRLLTVLWQVVSRWPESRSARSLKRTVIVNLAALAGFLLAPLAATPMANVVIPFNDPDGDGMLEDFQAGAYSWFDVVGPTWASFWLTLNLVIGVALWMERRSRRAAELLPPFEASGLAG